MQNYSGDQGDLGQGHAHRQLPCARLRLLGAKRWRTRGQARTLARYILLAVQRGSTGGVHSQTWSTSDISPDSRGGVGGRGDYIWGARPRACKEESQSASLERRAAAQLHPAQAAWVTTMGDRLAGAERRRPLPDAEGGGGAEAIASMLLLFRNWSREDAVRRCRDDGGP
ncbi:hypothetical protein T492DRAFT_364350 [Pavlovales sp. CCMP2436]|nr:hypothetical protein T492DRAFT_364350 [Pavlovales sp. CCMP2436]